MIIEASEYLTLPSVTVLLNINYPLTFLSQIYSQQKSQDPLKVVWVPLHDYWMLLVYDFMTSGW